MSSNSALSPNLEFYRKQAKSLLKAVQSGESAAISRIRKSDSAVSAKSFRLADAQRILARENGFPSWPRFKAHIESAEPVQVAAPTEDFSVLAKMSSDAVQAKTGRGWAEWIALLDAENASSLPHKEIATILDSKFGVGPWWRQMVAVGYGQARGLRSNNMSSLGSYQVSVSRTINASESAVFKAWADSGIREKWLSDARMTIRRSTEPKSLRITWEAGGNLDVYIVRKGDNKSQCTADHNKLSNSEDVQTYRAYWSAALERLKAVLES